MRKKPSQSKSTESAPAGSKTLVIAEKPSVAADLAKVLKVAKQGEIFENDQWVIWFSLSFPSRVSLRHD